MSDSDKVPQPEHIDRNGNGTNSSRYGATKGQKFKRHCARFWWLWFFVFAGVVLVVVLPIIYVAFPHLAQKAVNQSSSTVLELQFLNPTANSVQISQKTDLHSSSHFAVTLDGFNAANYLVTNGTFATSPILFVDIPEAHIKKGDTELDVTNFTAQVTDMQQLIDYSVQVMTQENVTTAQTGKTNLHLGKLPTTTVNYNSSTTYKTLNSLQGFNVTDSRINTTTGALTGVALIPNPSAMTIELGDVTFDLNTTQSGKVGAIAISDLIIRPGNNSIPYAGTMNQTLVLSDLVDGFIDLKVIGTSAIRNGEHLPYYEAAIAAVALPLHLNVLVIIQDSQ